MADLFAVVDDDCFAAHHAREPHPERPERLTAARAGLRRALGDKETLELGAPEASAEDLGRIHSAPYLQALEQTLRRGWGRLDPDTYCSPGSREAAHRAAGGAARLSRALVRDEAHRGFALVRPPGHHAEPDRAMGFCLLNNVAVAADAAIEAGATRVAIVDWDVHHGNGTQHIFERREDVLFVSLHQYPFYPGTGAPTEIGVGEGVGRTVNVAMPAGCGDHAYGEAFRRVVVPALTAHAPDVILVSAGFDAHARDPLGSIELTSPCYGAMTSTIVQVAEALGHGRVGFVLEGGYDLIALDESVAATVRAARGARSELPEGSVSESARAAIEASRAAISAAWPDFGGP